MERWSINAPYPLPNLTRPWRPTATARAMATEIASAARRQGVSAGLAEAVAWQESRFDPAAISPKGALGVMQLMPSTARLLGVDPYNAAANIQAGVAYLGWLARRYDGDIIKTLAAYNAGPQAVDRYQGIPPYRETQEFVSTVLDRAARSAAVQAQATYEEAMSQKSGAASGNRPTVAQVTVAARPVQPAASNTLESSPVQRTHLDRYAAAGLVQLAAAISAIAACLGIALSMACARIEWWRGLAAMLGVFVVASAITATPTLAGASSWLSPRTPNSMSNPPAQ